MPQADRLSPFLLGIGYFLFGLATISRQYTFDAVSYLLDVERTELSLPMHAEKLAYNFFHSQHLLFSFFVYGVYHFWLLLGYHGSALLPAQILNLMEGAVTLGLTFAVMREVTHDAVLSLLCALLLGFSYAFWDNTAMVSDHMASCLVAVLLFRSLLRLPSGSASPGRYALLGCLNGLGFLMHQVNGLLGVMFVTALVSDRGRWKLLAAYGLAAAVTAGVPYLVVGVFLLGNSSPGDFLFWCFYYAMPGVIDVAGHYGTVGVAKIAELLSGFGASVIGGFYWMNRIFETRFLQRNLVPALAFSSLVLFVFVLLMSRLRRSPEPPGGIERRALRLSASWFLAYALLLYWWWPSYYQLWAIPLVGFAIFTAAFLHRNLRSPVARHRPVLAGLILLVALIASANAVSAYGPSHDIGNNDYYGTAEEIGRLTRAGDLIVIPGDDEYETYIPYFSKRDAASLHALLVEHVNEADETFEDLDSRMERAWEGGHHVYIVSELRDSARVYRDVYALHHLSNDDVASRFRRYEVEKTVAAKSLKLYKLRPPEE